MYVKSLRGYFQMNNFKPAIPDFCLINTVDEMDNVFIDTGIMLDFGDAIDIEFIATDTAKGWLDVLHKNNPS